MPADDILAELRRISAKLDLIHDRLSGSPLVDLPIWDCGHRHLTRAAAIACKSHQGQPFPAG